MVALPSRAAVTDVDKTKPEMIPIFGDFRDFVAQLPGGAPPSELTIDGGTIAAVAGSHSVDTEGDAAADDLDNMAIDDLPEGALVRLHPANAARVVTIRDQQSGDGEFVLRDGAFAMNDASCEIEFQLRGTQWVEQWRAAPAVDYLTEAEADALYADIAHDHDGVYSPVAHDHAGVYSPVGHDHSGVYEPADGDLSAIAALDATAGLLAKTGANAYSRRSIAGTSPISVANGDGQAGNPTVSINTATFLMLAAQDQSFTGGVRCPGVSLGTLGSFTVDPGDGPLQYGTNNGAFTLTAPANDGACDLLITNGASAGAITFSGFTVGASTGDALTTTNGHRFLVMIRRINSVATYMIKALQ